jgi:hypothetical protein
MKHAESISGRDKAPLRFIEDIMFDEDVASGSEEENEEGESESLVSEQSKFSNVNKEKNDSSYDISAYLEGIDEEESDSEGECNISGEKDEFGNYL